MTATTVRYCGRDWTRVDLATIRAIIAAPDRPNRATISRRVCESLGWRRPNGSLKDMSCRVALLRMERDGLLVLPAPRNGNGNRKGGFKLTTGGTAPSLCCTLSELGELSVSAVRDRTDSRLWNELMARHHYLGHANLPGAQLRYLVRARDQEVAALGFGAAAWQMADRDRWIGWDRRTREQNLGYVANNNRFLILPHVRVKNLASRVLGVVCRRIAVDWQERYGYRVWLLETLVERRRFRGTCYRAANWQCVGVTKGRGKLDRTHRQVVPLKDIYVYPLAPQCQHHLKSLPSPHSI